MVPQGIAKRYATALFNAALDKKIEGEINEELQSFRTLLADNPSFRAFLLSPQVLTEDKTKLLEDALGGRAVRLFYEFVMLVIDKKRFLVIDEMIDAYNYLYERHLGVVEVKAITAVPMAEKMAESIRKRLSDVIGKKVRLTQQVEPDIIGGIILIMEDKIIDGSVRFELEKLKRELDEIRV